MLTNFIKADNHAGFNVEAWTPAHGWRPSGLGNPHVRRGLAMEAMKQLQAAAPEREFRVYEALAARGRAVVTR